MKMECFRFLPKGIYFLIFATYVCKLLLHIDARNLQNVTITKVVSTKYGPVRGKEAKLSTGKSVLTYLGIPYAFAKRFEQPRSASEWHDVLNATSYGKVCSQLGDRFEQKSLKATSEECLFVNVYVPKEGSSMSFSVMVWFHGEDDHSTGHVNTDGSYLATEGGVIVVIPNYRFGIFGYLSTGDDQIKGNFGSLDQVEALRWVRDNIESFGGDPDNITLFGALSGAVSVSLLMLSPLTSGLYRNVVLQSGTAVAPFATIEKEVAAQTAIEIGRAINCTDSLSLKSCLTEKPAEDLTAAQGKVARAPLMAQFAAVVDGHFLLDSPANLLREGKFNNKTRVIIGINKDDGSTVIDKKFKGCSETGCSATVNTYSAFSWDTFKSAIKAIRWISNQNEQVEEALIYEYTAWDHINDPNITRQNLIDAVTDAAFRVPALVSAQYFAQHGATTFLYQAEYRTPTWLGGYHGSEAGIVFGENHSQEQFEDELNFTKETIQLWANFFKSDDPSTAAIHWPRHTTASGQYLVLHPSKFAISSRLLQRRKAFWTRLVPFLAENGLPVTRTATTSSPTTTTCERENKVKENKIQGLVAGVTILSLLVIVMGAIIIWQCRTRKDAPKPTAEE